MKPSQETIDADFQGTPSGGLIVWLFAGLIALGAVIVVLVW